MPAFHPLPPMIRILLRLLAGLALVIVILVGVAFVMTRPDVPELIPNVNDKPIGTLSLAPATLHTFYGDEAPIEEGRLVVPENRALASTNHIELFFRVMRTGAADPLPPVFFFAGGPGSSSSRVAQTSYYYLFREIQAFADVVLIDQRGTGGSHPNLQCHNQLGLPTDITENATEVGLATIAQAAKKCADRFRKKQIDLPAYNSQESAYDIEAVRAALGYDTISLFGYSYGTALAQFYIRAYPDRVANAIFAGPLPTDASLKLPSNINGIFTAIDSLLAADRRTQPYEPGFVERMQSVHATLAAEPRFIQLPLMDAVGSDDGFFGNVIFKGISLIKPHWELTLTDQYLQMMVASRLGSPFWTRRLPEFYYQMSEGNYQDAGNFLRNFRREQLPNALFFTASCATRYSEARWNAASKETDFALRHTGISFGRMPAVCDAMGVPIMPGLNEPVSADTPVMLIGGTLDTQTPIVHLNLLADRFPNHLTLIVENASHTDLVFPESGTMIQTYLQGEYDDDAPRAYKLQQDISFNALTPFRYSIQDTLFATIEAEGIEAAIARYHAIRNAHQSQDDYLWDLGENSLNALGYRLLRAGMNDEAIQIFELNTEIFPQAYNPFNSLGEAYMAAGRWEDARKALEQAIMLNRYDGNSYRLLHQIDQALKSPPAS